MIITNMTDVDYWFGPMHLLGGSGQTLYLDDTSDTSLYLLDDEVADAVNTLVLASNITVSSAASPFPRATGTPALLHGDGSPDGLVYAPQGSLYLRRDSVQSSTSLYSKQTGVTENTGWVSVIAAVGDLIPSAAPTRNGCLLCNGDPYLRATYPVLFSVIGTTYGAPDDDHFNVPDFRGRLPLGAGMGSGTGATMWTLGEQPSGAGVAGGEQTHTLTFAESGLPAHSHDVTDPGHVHAQSQSAVATGGTQLVGTSAAGSGAGNNGNTYQSATGISIQDNTAVNASAHNILPPVSVVNWFIVYG